MMSNFSIELYKMLEDPYFELFDFKYDFYTDDEAVKKKFEQMFIDHYYFHEIGFETGARFKHSLKSKLNLMSRKYEQLYESELRAKDIDFLLNKDLREEFTRTVDTAGSTTASSRNESTSNSSSNSTSSNNVTAESSGSNLDNGLSNADADKRKTSHSKDSNNASSKFNDSNTSTQDINAKAQTDNEQSTTEKTVFISRGNIGVTSSAELLQRYRDVMININEMMIDECRDLFMLVF